MEGAGSQVWRRELVKIKKKTFYTCDVGEGGTRLLQTRLSFSGKNAKTVERDQKGYLGLDDDSVGQLGCRDALRHMGWNYL